jgi:hypothetical protein
MRSEYCEKKKACRKQRGLLKLLALSRESRAHPACNVYLNHDKAGKASNSPFSAELLNFGKHFSRVGKCENHLRVKHLMSDR